LKVTPLGSAPVSVRDGVGVPVAVTVKVPAVPTTKVALLALVIAGAWSAFTAMLRACVADCGPPALESVTLIVKLNGLPVAVVGVPVIAPVLELRVRPGGNVPVELNVAFPAPPDVPTAWL
jgi:hypothetical protein